ncbi:unnamed protein product [Calypogeia fissa]
MSFLDLEAGGHPPSRRGITKETDPSQALAAGVFQINTAVSTFKRLVNTLGTPKDTPELREKLHKTRQHIGQLAKDTGARLKSASEVDQYTDVTASKKVGDAKLAKDFQAVLKEFQKTQKIAAEREGAYSPFVPAAVQPQGPFANELKLQSEESQESRLLLAEQRRQDILQLDNEVVFNEAVIEEREQGIREIQQQIGEVNEIFKDLAVLVNEQGVMIDDIDSNIENSYAATTQASRQLGKAVTSQKSNNTMSCLLLVIFAVLLLIIVIVMAA